RDVWEMTIMRPASDHSIDRDTDATTSVSGTALHADRAADLPELPIGLGLHVVAVLRRRFLVSGYLAQDSADEPAEPQGDRPGRWRSRTLPACAFAGCVRSPSMGAARSRSRTLTATGAGWGGSSTGWAGPDTPRCG